MLTQRFNRFLMFALVAACGLSSAVIQPASAGDCGCESACLECAPVACDGACDCPPRRRHNLIRKSLDLVAGGIEKVLGLDKIHCGPGCDGGCDSVGCDDGCDAMTLQELSRPSPPQYLHQTQPIAPAQPIAPTQRVPAELAPYIQAPGTPQYHSGGQVLGAPQNPQNQMRIGEPSVVEPQQADPGYFAPPVHPQEELRNPFLDDARVISKRRVRPTSYEQSEAQPKRKASQAKNRDPRYSRNYAPSSRLVRTVR
jgi:hypothetical protein